MTGSATSPALTAGAIAEKIDGALSGDATTPITGVASLRSAGPGDIAYLADGRYAAYSETTEAAALIVGLEWDGRGPAVIIRVADPSRSFTQVAALYSPPVLSFAPGIHATAVVAEDAVLGADVTIGPGCVVESGVCIGDRSVLRAQCFVGCGTVIGADTVLHSKVSIREHVQLGDRVILHDGCVIGADGFGYDVRIEDGAPTIVKVPQRGVVIVGDDVEIGANSTVDRARFGATRIGNHVKIDNLVQIGHNVVIGDLCGIAAQSGVSGSSRLGDKVTILGQVGVAGHVTVGEGATVGGRSAVTRDVAPGAHVSGDPARPHDQTMRVRALMGRLPRLRNELNALTRRMEALERESGDEQVGGAGGEVRQ